MALFKSQLVTQASGSVGGTTYSHNAGGLYMRARSIPVNPNTQNQANVKAALTAGVNTWTEQLTQQQRNAWDLYALNVPLTNALGDSRPVSGQNMFLRTFIVEGQIASKFSLIVSPTVDAPSIFNLGDFTTPGNPTYSAATGFSMTFTNTDPWANETTGFMLIFQGRPRNPARTYFRGPWRLMNIIRGNDAAAPVSPKTVTAGIVAVTGFPIVAGQKIRTAISVIQPDGRLSTRRELNDAIATA